MDSTRKTMRMHWENEIPAEVVRLSELFASAGFKIHLVGGCVRDLLLGRKAHDYDFTTSATIEEMQSLLRANSLRYNDKYLFLNYVQVYTDNDDLEPVDISCYHGKDLDEDLKDRDLTINALAYDIQAGEIVDCTGGLEDLRNRIIRYSRPLGKDNPGDILRALRFALELDFRIDPQSYRAMEESVVYMEGIRTSTLVKGMTKLLRGARNKLTG